MFELQEHNRTRVSAHVSTTFAGYLQRTEFRIMPRVSRCYPGLQMKRFKDRVNKNRPQTSTTVNTDKPGRIGQATRPQQCVRSDQNPGGMLAASNTDTGTNKSGSPSFTCFTHTHNKNRRWREVVRTLTIFQNKQMSGQI